MCFNSCMQRDKKSDTKNKSDRKINSGKKNTSDKNKSDRNKKDKDTKKVSSTTFPFIL